MSTPESPEQFEARREALFEKLQLKEQYKSQIKALNEAGILEILPETNEIGIVGIDGREYPVPTISEIKKRIQDPETIALLEAKFEEGFKDLLLVPHAMPLSVLADRFAHELKRKVQKENLHESEINPDRPFTMQDEMVRSDAEGELLYLQKDGNPENAKTKREILEAGEAWQVMFLDTEKRNTESIFSLSDQELESENQVGQGESRCTPESLLTEAIVQLRREDVRIAPDVSADAFAVHQYFEGAFVQAKAWRRVPQITWMEEMKAFSLNISDQPMRKSNYRPNVRI
ncbi:hypothetical protein ACFL2D_00835 [Patescibacteria group bacterium]